VINIILNSGLYKSESLKSWQEHVQVIFYTIIKRNHLYCSVYL